MKDLNIGLLYMVAISSLTVVGIIMPGWSSNNKYATLGAMRSAAQAVSYEVPLVLSLLGPVMLAGTMSMGQLVEALGGTWFGFLPGWFVLPPVRGVPGVFHLRPGRVQPAPMRSMENSSQYR